MIRIFKITGLFVACVLTACANRPSEREMNFLGSALTKVSAAVDATVRYRRPAEGVSEEQLLMLATAHDPALMKPFDSMTLRVLRVGQDSAVLACQPGSGAALLEDAGCTARLDLHRWSEPGNNLCEFTLDLKAVCVR